MSFPHLNASPGQSIRPQVRSFRGAERGFSLMEVVIAMGIISFCLVGMLGLLTVAASAGRESVDRTESSLLFAKVVNQLKLKPFDKEQLADPADRSIFPLPALQSTVVTTPEPFLVDEQNLYVGTAADAGAMGSASRLVKVSVLDSPDLEIDKMNAPPAASVGNLSFVKVEVWSPAGAYRADAPSTSTNVTIYQTELSPLEQ